MNETTQSNNWPYNLLFAMEECNPIYSRDDPLDYLDDPGTFEVAMSMSHLTPREKKVLRLRYEHEMTLREVGKECGVTQERIRQVEAKAMRKLRWNKDVQFVLTHGVRTYIDQRIEAGIQSGLAIRRSELEKLYQEKINLVATEKAGAEVDKRLHVLVTPVEELELSVRAFNCLKRAGCDTVSEIISRYPTYEDARLIRNLGSKSLDEISTKLLELGVVWPGKTEEDDANA